MLLSAALLALAFLPTPTWAGCIVDGEREARWAAAPLIVQGTITGIELRWDDEHTHPTVYERVQVDVPVKGAVTRGGLLLRTWLPSGLCPSPVVFPIGAQVYVVGTPDAEGAIDINVCTDDVGVLAHLKDDLRQIAAQNPHAAGVFPGTSPRPPQQRTLAVLPQDADLHAWVRPVPEGEVYAATLTVLPDTAHASTAIVEANGLEVALGLPHTAFLPVLTEPWPVVPGSGLRWRAGVPIPPQGETVLGAALRPPDAVVGLAWRPAEAVRPESHTQVSLHEGTWPLHIAPGGEVLVTLPVEQQADVLLLEHRRGWRHIWLQTDTLEGDAWVPDAAEISLAEGRLLGGEIRTNADPVALLLPEGALIRQPDTAAVVARVREPVWVWWLSTAEDRAWVVVDTPLGLQVGMVDCVHDEQAYRTRCAVVAP